VRREVRFPAHEVQRRPPLGAGLGQDDGSGRKVERRKAGLPGDFRTRRAHPEAAGNHEVDDEEEVAVHRPDEALAEAPQISDRPAVHLVQRRRDRSHQERIGDADSFERLLKDARPERVQVELDVRQFRHAISAR